MVDGVSDKKGLGDLLRYATKDGLERFVALTDKKGAKTIILNDSSGHNGIFYVSTALLPK